MDTRRELAQLILAPTEIDRGGAEARMERIDQLSERKELLERQLAGRLQENAFQDGFQAHTAEDLAERLEEGVAFIDLVRYKRHVRDTSKRGRAAFSRIASYVAFVLQADRGVKRVELGPAAPIDFHHFEGLGHPTSGGLARNHRAAMNRNPLVLSGLVLAGANRERETDVWGIPKGEDGILTAEEIVGLCLEGLELAVLSACETGLGKVAGGEGVFGLQRAFHIAGTRNVIASLWKVDDEHTMRLMTLFYENLWVKEMGALEALRQAQLAIYYGDAGDTGSPSRTTRDPSGAAPASVSTTARTHPRYWGAWILSGEPGSITPIARPSSAGLERAESAPRRTSPSPLAIITGVLFGVFLVTAFALIDRRMRHSGSYS